MFALNVNSYVCSSKSYHEYDFKFMYDGCWIQLCAKRQIRGQYFDLIGDSKSDVFQRIYVGSTAENICAYLGADMGLTMRSQGLNLSPGVSPRLLCCPNIEFPRVRYL